MAVKDGLPATDFSRQNREWVKSVADAAAGGGGGGGGDTDRYSGWDAVIKLTLVQGEDDPVYTASYDKGSFQTIIDSANTYPVQALFYVFDSGANTCTPFIMGGIQFITDDSFVLMNILSWETYTVQNDGSVVYDAG